MSTLSKDITEMDFNELRQTVADMRAELTKYKRLINMISEDIENSSFGRSILLQNGKLATEIKVLAGKVESAVTDENMESVITQIANEVAMKVGRGFDVSEAESTTTIPTTDGSFDTSTIYKYTETVTDDDGNTCEVVTYYFYDETLERWCPIEGDSIYSVFEQTATGFKLKGNVVIDGNTVVTENLKLSGNVTWDMSNSPVKSQYSADGVSEWADEFNADTHKFMRMSFDGGKTWSNATKVVGTDGAPGESWGEASVTPEAVFEALTDEGALEGMFAVFNATTGRSELYINATFVHGDFVTGNNLISKTDDNNQVVEIKNGQIFLLPKDDSYPKMRIALNYSDDSSYPFIQFGQGSSKVGETVNGLPTDSGTAVMYKDADGFYLNFNVTSGRNQGFAIYDAGVLGDNPCIIFHQGTQLSFNSGSAVDFTNATVTWGKKNLPTALAVFGE